MNTKIKMNQDTVTTKRENKTKDNKNKENKCVKTEGQIES